MNKNLYTKYIQSVNVEGSNKASSYIKAIDWLCEMIKVEPFTFADCKNVWALNSIDRLQELYEFVQLQKRKGTASSWSVINIPKSYLRDGFCSAALKSYLEFLIENNYEQGLFDIFDTHEGNENELPTKLDVNLNYPDYLIEGLDEMQGQEVVRSVRIRSNQNIFRKMILSIYQQSCCITGMNIPAINRASHIIPWAEDKAKRLDPRNGLCLSATYDAAFDRNLISLDDDYRIILSRGIKDYATNECVNLYFVSREGDKINLPERYKPNKDNLAQHRDKGEF